MSLRRTERSCTLHPVNHTLDIHYVAGISLRALERELEKMDALLHVLGFSAESSYCVRALHLLPRFWPRFPFSKLAKPHINAEYCLWDLLSRPKSMFWCKLNLIVVKVAVVWGTPSWWGGRALRRASGGMICYESLIFCVHVWFSVVLWEVERSLLRIMHVIDHYVVYLLLGLTKWAFKFLTSDRARYSNKPDKNKFDVWKIWCTANLFLSGLLEYQVHLYDYKPSLKLLINKVSEGSLWTGFIHFPGRAYFLASVNLSW